MIIAYWVFPPWITKERQLRMQGRYFDKVVVDPWITSCSYRKTTESIWMVPGTYSEEEETVIEELKLEGSPGETVRLVMKNLDRWRPRMPIPAEDAVLMNLRKLGEDIYLMGGFSMMQNTYREARERFKYKGEDNPYVILDKAWEGIGGWLP